ncbi:hypothetical protein [Algicola sagamiensis]|uniref:hypothetical protein n=1 Tax=Algicola sagamiensis TaxID=163869 RepID=UPI00036C4158|nr:hypothetical protein [Algicola sagamiensis]
MSQLTHLADIITKHEIIKTYYDSIKQQVKSNQFEEDKAILESLDHKFRHQIQAFLEEVQQVLTEKNYQHGLTQETVTLSDEPEKEYIIRMDLAVSDMKIPSRSINQPVFSNNVISFQRIGQTDHISCQFSNHFAESDVFQLILEEGESFCHCHDDHADYEEELCNKMDDFMTFILLSRRSGLHVPT